MTKTAFKKKGNGKLLHEPWISHSCHFKTIVVKLRILEQALQDLSHTHQGQRHIKDALNSPSTISWTRANKFCADHHCWMLSGTGLSQMVPVITVLPACYSNSWDSGNGPEGPSLLHSHVILVTYSKNVQLSLLNITLLILCYFHIQYLVHIKARAGFLFLGSNAHLSGAKAKVDMRYYTK